jgi:uncharacterized protein YjiS (DUF1127 family)
MAKSNYHAEIGENARGSPPVVFLTDIKSVALLIASSTLTLISRLTGVLRAWRRRALERAELAQMSQGELHDIGVSSADHWTETHKPFCNSSRRPTVRVRSQSRRCSARWRITA